MAEAKYLQSNFTKGELAPQIEGRTDLAAFFNGCKTLENFLIYPQGGVFRRPGTKFSNEVKTSAKVTRLIPFKFNISQAYAIEAGDLYFRFYRRGFGVADNSFHRIEVAGVPVEVATPYIESELSELQWVQSADILYIVHPAHQPRKLSRTSDTSWVLSLFASNPPPSYEADDNLNTTLDYSAAAGAGVTFTAGAAVFLNADVGRYIIAGAARAIIKTLVGIAPSTQVTADVIDTFTAPPAQIPAGGWKLHLSPQCTLQPSVKQPVGSGGTVTAGVAAFRTTDASKYIKVYGGMLQLTNYVSATQFQIQVLSVLNSAASPPAAAPAGSWTLEVASWSAALGWPSAVEFHQGRLLFAGTASQPTTWWGSASDDYQNFAVGSLADNAIEYTIANRSVNVIEWLKSLGYLFIGDAENEHAAKGPGIDQPISGEIVPYIAAQSGIGSASAMAAVISDAIIFIQAFFRKVFALAYAIEKDKYAPKELTVLSRHICGDSGFLKHPATFAKEPNSILFLPRADGQLAALTNFPDEEVAGWNRWVTDGAIESVCTIPNIADGYDDLMLIVKRTINGATKRYVEIVEQKDPTLASRSWRQVLTDCAITDKNTGAPTAVIPGLNHLEGKDVDVILNPTTSPAVSGSYKGRYTVTAGVITLPEEMPTNTEYEVGLPYTSTLKTMRPALQGVMLEGHRRRWVKAFLRLRNSIGANVNGFDMQFAAGGQQMDVGPPPFSGDKAIPVLGWDTDGYITVIQSQPYPLEILALFGKLEIGDM